MRLAALQDGLPGPAIERRARHADCLSCGFGIEPELARPLPMSDSVASDRRCDIWGLRVDQTRREPGGSDNMAGQAKHLHRGSLLAVDSTPSASETPGSL